MEREKDFQCGAHVIFMEPGFGSDLQKGEKPARKAVSEIMNIKLKLSGPD